jgi:LacI family transcriptional regulator
MAKKTIKDVAAAAGVGTATVERVINGRGGVRPATVARVIGAAKKVGYLHHLPEQYRGTIRIEVILVRPETAFYSRLNQAFERIAASLDNAVFVHRTFVRENDPVAVANYISKPAFPRSALIVVAPDHPLVAESLRRESKAGVEVVQIVTRSADDLPYVGIDNYAAGRTAAFYMSNMLSARPGSFVAICHSGAYENHRQRIRGFSDYISERGGPQHRFVEVMFNFDDPVLCATSLKAAMHRIPDLVGIYTAGGDNAPVADTLRTALNGPFWIGHELSDQTRTYLRAGLMSVVLDQAPEVQARRSLDMVLSRLGIIDLAVGNEPVRFMTICAENV